MNKYTSVAIDIPYNHVGVDEAGRGPWAGPVVAAAVFLNGAKIEGLNDSKKLTATQREILYEKIVAHCMVGIGRASHKEIDRFGIKKATNLAMNRAIKKIHTRSIELLIIDGNDAFSFPFPHRSFIRGDSLFPAISAASIIAKVTRDRMMRHYGKKYPQYGFELHKGYGTKIHQEALRLYGPCPIHRTSYKPIASLLLSDK